MFKKKFAIFSRTNKSEKKIELFQEASRSISFKSLYKLIYRLQDSTNKQIKLSCC